MKTFFMNRDKSFDEIQVLKETPHLRQIKFLSGERKGKTINAHPKGVAWGNMYPRIFEANTKPQNTFIFNGRALASTYDFEANPKAVNFIPPKETYIFQPITGDIIDSINLKKNILLTGGSGVGKTSCILQIAHAIRQPVVRINFTPSTLPHDLLGKKELINGETIWVDGLLPTAMKNGYWIIFDEIDSAPPEILPTLYPVLEKISTLTMKEADGEIIMAHPQFRCFATANTVGAMKSRRHRFNGTNEMSEALLNRFDVFHMENMSSAQELKLVREVFPQLSTKMAKRISDFASRVRSSDEKKEFSFTVGDFSTRQVLSWAEKAALHRNASKGAKLSWLDKVNSTEQEAAIKALALVFGQEDVKAIQVKAPRKRSVSNKPQPTKALHKIAA